MTWAVLSEDPFVENRDHSDSKETLITPFPIYLLSSSRVSLDRSWTPKTSYGDHGTEHGHAYCDSKNPLSCSIRKSHTTGDDVANEWVISNMNIS